MAADAIAVLDALNIDRAHVVGQSLGGMIAQTMAIEHRDRIATLTSISANTGNFDYGQPTDEALTALTSPPGATREAQIDRDVHNKRVWASPSFFDEEDARTYFAECYDRGYSPTGGLRQFNAILESGSREDALASLGLPVLVVHGALDPLIGPEAATRTAAIIPGAELLLIDGLGHDLPVQMWQQIISAITAMAARAVA
jgi:pimeloyl-ACP methyl ester carboxylesterase